MTEKLKPFIVCMDSSYIRDAQMMNTEGLSDDDLEEGSVFCNAEYEDLWHDIEPNPYIDFIWAENEKQACEIAGKNKRYDPRILFAVAIDSQMEGEKIDV